MFGSVCLEIIHPSVVENGADPTPPPHRGGGVRGKLLPLPLNAEGALFYGRSPLSSEVVTSFLVISENCRQFISNINLLLLFFPSPEEKKIGKGSDSNKTF